MSSSKNILVILMLFLQPIALWAQQGRAPLNRDIYQAYQEHLNNKEVDFHTSIKPYLRKDLYRETELDTVLPPHLFYWMRALDKPKRELDKWEMNWRAGPILDLSLGADLSDPESETLKYIAGGGFFVEADIGPTLTANFSIRSYTAQTPSYVESYTDVWGVMPGMGYAGEGGAPHDFSDLNGYVSFTPHKWFNFQLGRGKNFIGDGYRSLLLSDNAYSYPYFKIETSVWHIKYMILYTAMKDVRMGPGNSAAHNEKYSTMHYLSWNVSKRFNFSFFESIVWQGQDTLVDRGFDVSYLNPMIFFRPVEYSLGSADNALMGFGLKVKIANKSQLYAQFVLDEFLLSEVRSGTGWFGNKQGFQVGFKTFSPFKIRGLALQTEFNYVRPFMYTHGSPTQNYAHWNQALAHPLGSNFYESVNIIDYRFKRFHIQEQFNYALTGSDTAGYSYGNNIFRPESDRPVDEEGRSIDYGYYVGKASSEHLFYNKIRVGYILDPSSGLRIELGHLYRQRYGEGFKNATNMFFVGIRTTLFQHYNDF